MNLEAQLNSLQERLTAALRQLPGATAIYIYGSRATCRTDGYADLDLQVYIHGRVMCAVWPQFLERVGPVETAWPLNGAADNTTFTIFFSHESYYHKVDIGLSEDAAVQPPPKRVYCSGRKHPLRRWQCVRGARSIVPPTVLWHTRRWLS